MATPQASLSLRSNTRRHIQITGLVFRITPRPSLRRVASFTPVCRQQANVRCRIALPFVFNTFYLTPIIRHANVIEQMPHPFLEPSHFVRDISTKLVKILKFVIELFFE